MKTAIFPGSFDPITLGHQDIIKKSLNLFDEGFEMVMVTLVLSPQKASFFSTFHQLLLSGARNLVLNEH